MKITVNIVKGLYDGITTAELDDFSANYASTLAAQHPDFGVLAGRIAVSNLHKQTSKSFSSTIERLFNDIDPNTNELKPQIAEDVYEIVMSNSEVRHRILELFIYLHICIIFSDSTTPLFMHATINTRTLASERLSALT